MSNTPPSPPTPPTREIVPSNARRDLIIALASGLVILVIVVGGIVFMGRQQGQPSTNQLSGKILEKHNSGVQEQEITIGKKGAKSHISDSGYSFKLQVDGDRTYEVPVTKEMFDAKKVGDKQDFIRPVSEQK